MYVRIQKSNEEKKSKRSQRAIKKLKKEGKVQSIAGFLTCNEGRGEAGEWANSKKEGFNRKRQQSRLQEPDTDEEEEQSLGCASPAYEETEESESSYEDYTKLFYNPHKKAVVQLAENNKIRDNVRIKAEIHDDDSLLNNVVIRIGLSDEDHVEITNEDILLKRNNQRVTSSSISQGIRSSLVKKKPRNSNQSLQLSRSFIENTSQRQSSTEQSKSFDQLRVTLERSLSLTRKSSQKKFLI